MRDRRVAVAEVVRNHRGARLGEAFHRGPHLVVDAQHRGLGDLEVQPVGGDARQPTRVIARSTYDGDVRLCAATLTATVMSPGRWRRVSSDRSSTARSSSVMSELRSATGRNAAGSTADPSGRTQRTSASYPASRPSGQRHDRLEPGHELAVAEPGADGPVDVEAALRLARHDGVGERVPVATLALRLGQRDAGVAQQVVGSRPPSPVAMPMLTVGDTWCGPTGCTSPCAAAMSRSATTDASAAHPRDPARGRGTRRRRRVPRGPGRRALGEPGRDMGDDHVARGVAERVVDVAQTVDAEAERTPRTCDGRAGPPARVRAAPGSCAGSPDR